MVSAAKKREHNEKKLAILHAAEQAQFEESRKIHQVNYAAALIQRCQDHKITKSKIREVLASPPPADPCCLISQIQKWFVEVDGDLDYKSNFGI
jgi:hypothetical protein